MFPSRLETYSRFTCFRFHLPYQGGEEKQWSIRTDWCFLTCFSSRRLSRRRFSWSALA